MELSDYVSSLHTQSWLNPILYGSKSSVLAQLYQAGMNVPPGIVLSKGVLGLFLADNQIDITNIDQLIETSHEETIQPVSGAISSISNIILQASMPEYIVDVILNSLGDLLYSNLAIRSSCIMEDLTSYSFAGQYSTLLNVKGYDNIVSAIKYCWASQYTNKVLAYAQRHLYRPILSPSMAVILQEMLIPEFSGVCFSEGPTLKTQDLSIVEYVEGIGEPLVSGEQTPSHIEVDISGKIKKSMIQPNISEIPPHIIMLIVKEAKKIEKLFGCPQDIEWALSSGRFYTLQSRPITTGMRERKKSLANVLHNVPNQQNGDP